MTRDELIQITHKLGYPYIWKNVWGKWEMGRNRPSVKNAGRPSQYWFWYEAVEVFVDVEFDGTHFESFLFYGDTLCQNKEEEAQETADRG